MLPGGALLIDTPGIREAGLWDGTGGAFADIEELAARCRFTDCGHTNEPGCAVREEADPERVEAWRKLEREQQWIEDRRQAARDREQLGRKYARAQRASAAGAGAREWRLTPYRGQAGSAAPQRPCAPCRRSRQTTQYGHGGFHGQPVTSLPHSAVSGSSSVTMWQISSPWFDGPSTRRSSLTVLGMRSREGCHASPRRASRGLVQSSTPEGA